MNASRLHNQVSAGYCFVCLKAIPVGEEVTFARLGIAVHSGDCAPWVRVTERAHDRSRRGRLRPVSEVLSLSSLGIVGSLQDRLDELDRLVYRVSDERALMAFDKLKVVLGDLLKDLRHHALDA